MLAKAITFLGLISLAACGSPQAIPKDNYYRLEINLPSKPYAAPSLEGVVEVERFLADGITGERALVYSSANSPGVVRQYHYHYWVDTPGRMLQERLTEYLRAANVATQVINPGLRINTNSQIKGRIIRYEHALGESSAKVIVEIELAVINLKDNKAIKLAVYKEEESAKDNSIPEAVAAFGRAYGRLLDKFTRDLNG